LIKINAQKQNLKLCGLTKISWRKNKKNADFTLFAVKKNYKIARENVCEK